MDEIQKIADEQKELLVRISAQAQERGLMDSTIQFNLQRGIDMSVQVGRQPDARRKLHMLTQASVYLGKAKALIEVKQSGT